MQGYTFVNVLDRLNGKAKGRGRSDSVDACAHLGDGSGFVIPSNQLNSVWVSKFETRKQRDGLDAEQPSVHIIAFKIARRSQLAAEKRIGQRGRKGCV